MMNNFVGNSGPKFAQWLPEQGPVYTGAFALDTETLPIEPGCFWSTPGFVLAAAYDGRRGYFVTWPHIAAFLRVHREQPIILHNAPSDLAVLNAAGVDGVYDRVEQNRVWDTQLLHRLFVLGTEGHTAFGKDQSTAMAETRRVHAEAERGPRIVAVRRGRGWKHIPFGTGLER